MRASTGALFFLVAAGLAFASGVDWLFIAFLAIGAGLLFFYKETPKAEEAAEQSPSPAPQQPVIIVQETGGEDLTSGISREIRRHLQLQRMFKEKREDYSGDIKSLKKQVSGLKKSLDHERAERLKKDGKYIK